MQSTCHIAIIMDGNGRWAELRGLPRERGHAAGADAVRRTVAAAWELELSTLTLFAFSCENWRRPRREIDGLFALFARRLRREAAECAARGIRLEIIGRRDRLGAGLIAAIAEAESETLGGDRLRLRIAIDYSSRDAVERAARRMARSRRPPPFQTALASAIHADPYGPDIDLLIRTGGEIRLSDQFPWEAAYAELLFTSILWPDFGRRELEEALDEFANRRRRFGGLPGAA